MFFVFVTLLSSVAGPERARASERKTGQRGIRECGELNKIRRKHPAGMFSDQNTQDCFPFFSLQQLRNGTRHFGQLLGPEPSVLWCLTPRSLI